MKKYLIVYYGDTPECVEGFKKDCCRTKKGAMHIKPGRQMEVTEDELKHIKEDKKCKHLLPGLRILGEKKDPPKKKEDKASEKKSEPSESEPQEAEKPPKKASKKVSKKNSNR